MPSFSCILDTSSIPESVHRGEMVKAAVAARQCSQPVRSVVIAADSYGVSQRLKKLDGNTFLLELLVPFLAPEGPIKYSVWAVSENGETGERQGGLVTIH